MQPTRRQFLMGASALVAGIALEDAIPLGRVWSFPSKIVLSQSMRESEFFVRLVTPDPSRFANYPKPGLVQYRVLKEELFERAAFWGDPRYCLPVKVNYISEERDTTIWQPSPGKIHQASFAR